MTDTSSVLSIYIIKNDNEEYLKIEKKAEQQVTSILFDGKRLLHLSLYSLMESREQSLKKYSKLIYPWS
ncbi:MAG TPA: hypothetical protein VKA95_06150 [Nitrososphaeraceae archaeon]|nr:hypothetical protein [Nitrososphaeraceae archaeon]